MALEEPSIKQARRAVIILIQVSVTAILTAVATWQLGRLLGLELNELDGLLLLGLPLAVFFFGGIFGLVVVAWIVGPLAALVLQTFNLKEQLAMVLAGVILALAMARWTLEVPDHPLRGIMYVVIMISLCALYWRLSKVLRPYLIALVAWELGVTAIALAQFAADDYLPNADFIILAFVIGLAPFVLLFTPKLLADVHYPEQKLCNRQWLSLVAIHGGGLAFLVPSLAFATSVGIGYARAAVHIQLLPLIGMWLVGAVVLAFLGWIVSRGAIGFGLAIALVAILWLASAYYAP